MSEKIDQGESIEAYGIEELGDIDMGEFEEEVEDKEMMNMHFKHILTRSNVDNSTHGVVSDM